MTNWGGSNNMKIFVSWSGQLSKTVAESIKTWLPCFINDVDVFYSPDDIEKGENWDSRISKELSDCKYGIICLTKENVLSPWINFEAGAIAKALDSKVATLMININPSDIKGPLSRYQGTKIDKDDFYQLVENINKQCDAPIKDTVLKKTFDGLWSSTEDEINAAISKYKSSSGKERKEINTNQAIEEILQLLRNQNSILNSPETLLPFEYIEHIFRNSRNFSDIGSNEMVLNEICSYLEWVLSRVEDEPRFWDLFLTLSLDELLEELGKYAQRNKRAFVKLKKLKDKLRNLENHILGRESTENIE